MLSTSTLSFADRFRASPDVAKQIGALGDSPGLRTLADLFISVTGAPGIPAGDSVIKHEQVKAFKLWVYVAVDRIAKKVAEQFPNISIRRDARAIEKHGGPWLSIPDRRRILGMLVKNEEDLEPAGDNHPLMQLFRFVNPVDTPFDLWYETVMYLSLTGEAYWYTPRNGFGLPAEIWVLPSHWLRVIPSATKLIEGYVLESPGFAARLSMGSTRSRFLPAEDVIPIRCKSPLSKLEGYSPLKAGAAWIDTATSIALARWHSFENGAFPGYALELSENSKSPDQQTIDRLRAQFRNQYGGVKNYGKGIVGTPGMKFNPLTRTPQEMDYPASAELIRDEVLALFGVPKVMAGLSTEVNRATHDGAQVVFASNVVNPMLAQIGQTLTQFLAEPIDSRLKIWFRDVTPLDAVQEIQETQLDWQMGAVTVNERRQQRGREPYEGELGNKPLIGAGLRPLEDVENPPDDEGFGGLFGGGRLGGSRNGSRAGVNGDS